MLTISKDSTMKRWAVSLTALVLGLASLTPPAAADRGQPVKRVSAARPPVTKQIRSLPASKGLSQIKGGNGGNAQATGGNGGNATGKGSKGGDGGSAKAIGGHGGGGGGEGAEGGSGGGGGRGWGRRVGGAAGGGGG